MPEFRQSFFLSNDLLSNRFLGQIKYITLYSH